jgi:multidrug resistance efflux pump
MMSTAFSRTMQSLDADDFRGSVVGLALVTALLAAWSAWFLLAQIALHEISDTAHLEVDAIGTVARRGDLKLVAVFPATALGRVRPGQLARLRLDSFPGLPSGGIAATVATVTNAPQNGRVHVELAIQPDPTAAIPLREGLYGTVEIEVERVSPATLLLRAVGQRVGQ